MSLTEENKFKKVRIRKLKRDFERKMKINNLESQFLVLPKKIVFYKIKLL